MALRNELDEILSTGLSDALKLRLIKVLLDADYDQETDKEFTYPGQYVVTNGAKRFAHDYIAGFQIEVTQGEYYVIDFDDLGRRIWVKA